MGETRVDFGLKPVILYDTTNTATGTATTPLRINPTGTTIQPVSGTVTANAGTGTFRVDPTGTTTQPVSGTVTANAGTGTFRNDPTGTTTQPISGTVTANAGTGTLSTNPTSLTTRDIGRVNTPSPTEVATGFLNVRLTDGAAFYSAAPIAEPATFYAVFRSIVPAANKYMATLFNTSATRKVVIQRVLSWSWSKTAVTGVGLEEELRFITARTAGTAVTPFAADSNDVLSAGITADTGSTAVTDSSLIRIFQTVNEEMTTLIGQAFNSTTINSIDWFGWQGRCIWEKKEGIKGLTLRQNQGITVKNITSSIVGAIDIVIEFTDEAA